MRAILRRIAWCAALVPAFAYGASCNVSTIGVAFGSYNVFNSSPADITGSVSVTCNKSSSYSVSLSSGSGTFSSRTLRNGSNVLNYNLFSDPTHLTIWGDGSGGTVTVSAAALSGAYTVYGRVPARQNVRAGAYSDSITVTVTF